MELKEHIETPELKVAEETVEVPPAAESTALKTIFEAIVASSAPPPAQQQQTKEAVKSLQQYAKQELWNHRIPLCFLLAFLLCHQLLLLWVATIIIWSLAEAIYPKLPLSMRLRVDRTIPEKWKTSKVVMELTEGLGQVRPFIIAPLYMFLLPMTLCWMAVHWVQAVFGKEAERNQLINTAQCISFRQTDQNPREEQESNFFHSPAFGLTCLAVFGCGLPAALTYLLYQKLGIDAILGFPSQDPRFFEVFVKTGLYAYSFGCCICILFFRTWMTFPLHFWGEDVTIELTPAKVRRRIHSWLTLAMTMNSPWSGRESMAWDEVKYVGYDAPHLVKLYPLPLGVFSPSSLIYKGANKLAQFVDGIVAQMPLTEWIYFSSSTDPLAPSSQLPVNVSAMDGEQRASLFYAIRKWAPHVVIDPRVQDKVVGTSVMQAPRYTQMWFELLTDKMPRRRLGALAPEDKLREGKITIKHRLSSGGQANVYVADKEGEEVVLKEFILSSADAVGALVESAGEFETESTLLSELQHDRIVKMLEFFAEDRRLYLVLERVPGTSLREHIKANGAMSEADVISLALQVADVLQYLHGQTPPVVHRDIAPDNIVYDGTSNVKVIDFSLAAAKKSRRTTSTMGKHSYAPPEQLREQPCPQSDIYALGATMYFLLTGADPRPITQSDVQSKVPEVSDKLAEIIKRATELDVENRYAGIEWMRLDLEALL